MASREDTPLANKRKETDDYFAAFLHQPPKAQGQSEDIIFDIELFDSNIPIYQLYSVLRNYFGQYYSIDTQLMLKIIESRQLDLETALKYIPYIHGAYVDIVFPSPEDSENGRENGKD